MTRVLKFGDYTFEDVGVELGDNFRDLVPRTSRLTGLDGGFDEYGLARAASEIGNVRFNMWLKAGTPGEMQGKRDALQRIASYRKRKLFVQPSDVMAAVRWCEARVNSLQLNETYATKPDVAQRVAINWQVSDPRWYSKEGMWYLDDGATLDTGLEVQGATATAVEDGDILTITNAGSAPTKPVITVGGPGGIAWYIGDPYTLGLGNLFIGELANATVQGFGMRQLSDDGRTLNEWFWLGTVESGEQLIVDCRACSVRYEAASGSENGYPDFNITAGFAFPSLEPGANRFEVFGTFDGTVNVSVDFFDAWM